MACAAGLRRTTCRLGAKTWDAIDAAIRVRDKVLLILSNDAIASDWVEDEVSKAFAEERRRDQLCYFPSASMTRL
jgi:TIR domain